MSMSTATAPEHKITTLSAIPAKRLADMSTKAIRDMISKDRDSLVPLTFYNEIYAYVVPADKATSMLKSHDDMALLLKDLKSVAPYIQVAANAGFTFAHILDEILTDNENGSAAVDFSGIARLLSNTPVAITASDEGTPINSTSVDFEGATYSGDDEDEDYSPFDRL